MSPAYRALRSIRFRPAICTTRARVRRLVQGHGVHADVAQAIGWDPALITLGAFKKLGLNASASDIKAYLSQLHGFAARTACTTFATAASAA